MRNRTIHFTKAHQMPFYLEAGFCHGRVRTRVKVRFSVWVRVKSALSKLLLPAQVSYEFVEGHKICIFIAHMKE